jgi:hypothetical protein
MPDTHPVEYWSDQNKRLLKMSTKTQLQFAIAISVIIGGCSIGVVLYCLFFRLFGPPLYVIVLIIMFLACIAVLAIVCVYRTFESRFAISDSGLIIADRRRIRRRILWQEIVDIDIHPLFVHVDTATTPKREVLRCIDLLDIQIMRATWLQHRGIELPASHRETIDDALD